MAREKVAIKDWQIASITEKEYGTMMLENVGGVFVQTVLFDDVKFQDENIFGELLIIYVMRRFANGNER